MTTQGSKYDPDHGHINRQIGTEPGQAQTKGIDVFLVEILV